MFSKRVKYIFTKKSIENFKKSKLKLKRNIIKEYSISCSHIWHVDISKYIGEDTIHTSDMNGRPFAVQPDLSNRKFLKQEQKKLKEPSKIWSKINP